MQYWKSLEELELPNVGAGGEFMSTPLADDAAQDRAAAAATASSEPLSSEPWARREFLKLMGASLALGSLSCVRRPAQKIVPYVDRPAEVTQGINNYYASSFADGLDGYGLVVTAREGRPIKADGNPHHPANRGAMSARAHAHILSLYDPDRLQGPRGHLFNKARNNYDTVHATWQQLDEAVVAALQAPSGMGSQMATGQSAAKPSPSTGTASSINPDARPAILTGPVGPSLQALMQEWAQQFGGRVYHWHPQLDATQEAQRDCYGQAVQPRFRYDQARFIISVGCDFLGAGLGATANTHLFARARKASPDMSELVVFESLLTLTGSNADTRYRLRPSQGHLLVGALLYDIIVQQGLTAYAQDQDVIKALNFYRPGPQLSIAPELLREVAQKLWSNRGQSLVAVGGAWGQTRHAHKLHVLANFLNHVLENDGKTIDHQQPWLPGFRGNQLGALVDDIQNNKISSLIIHGLNPVYSASAYDFANLLKQVPTVVYTGSRADETGEHAHWVAPDHHAMESWGDAEFIKNVYSIQQPTLRPLYKTRALGDSLLHWMAQAKGTEPVKWYDYVRAHWQRRIYPQYGGGFEAFWQQVLERGCVSRGSATLANAKPASGNTTSGAATSGAATSGVTTSGVTTSGASGHALASGAEANLNLASRRFRVKALASAYRPTQGVSEVAGIEPQSDIELVLYNTVGLSDGSLANVSWLQEFPDPISKVCWDNYFSFSPQTAQRRGLKQGDSIEVKVGTRTVRGPVYIQPGQSDHVVGVALGYGQKRAGQVANSVGLDAYALAQKHEGQLLQSALLMSFKKLEASHYPLACVQGHHSIDKGFHTQHGRQIVVESRLKDYLHNPAHGIHKHHVVSMWSGHEYKGHKWGMAVDLNSCTGCGACIVACQSENNIPVVGKKYVLEGREMHWMRVDRYYTGSKSDPGAVHMPVMCQHCDNAPCETVCPVAATTHGSEGTNDMIYNRCVGTRYCANNCPYKVRRFNWFEYAELKSPLHMALNPEVTVRTRGVMEKCTFCTHKITYAKHQSKHAGGDGVLKDGEVVTACEASCPAGAIVFGDLNDPNSRVSRSLKEQRSYALLEELNTKPAVHYKTKLRVSDELKSGAHAAHGVAAHSGGNLHKGDSHAGDSHSDTGGGH